MSDPRAARILTGSLPREVLRFGAPLALGMGLQTTFNLVDAYLIARLSPEVAGPSLGAVGLCDQLAALGTIVSYGISVASASLVSQAWGRGDRDAARRVAWQSLLLVFGLGLLMAVVGGFGAKVLLRDVIGAKGQVAALGAEYLSLVMGGSVTIFLVLHLATLLRAVGSSKTPVAWLVAGNVLNLLLAVLFVYGPGEAPSLLSFGPKLSSLLGIPRLELFGAGIATLLARALVIVPLALFAAKRLGFFGSHTPLSPEPDRLRQIARLAWPSSAELTVRMAAMLLTHALVARAFTTTSDQRATTALGIVFRFETMALFVSIGWGSAAQTFVGQNLGAGQIDRAKQSGSWAALYDAIMMVGLALLYLNAASHIVGFFDADPEVLRIARGYFGYVAPSYVALGVGIVLGSAMQGAGAPLRALLLDLLIVCCVQVPLSLLLFFTPGRSLQQVWLAVAVSYVGLALVFTNSYRRGRFLSAALA